MLDSAKQRGAKTGTRRAIKCWGLSVRQIRAQFRCRLMQRKWARSFTHICLATQVNQACLGETWHVTECWAEGLLSCIEIQCPWHRDSLSPSANFQTHYMNELSFQSEWENVWQPIICSHFMVPSPTEISNPEVSRAQTLPDGDYFSSKDQLSPLALFKWCTLPTSFTCQPSAAGQLCTTGHCVFD